MERAPELTARERRAHGFGIEGRKVERRRPGEPGRVRERIAQRLDQLLVVERVRQSFAGLGLAGRRPVGPHDQEQAAGRERRTHHLAATGRQRKLRESGRDRPYQVGIAAAQQRQRARRADDEAHVDGVRGAAQAGLARSPGARQHQLTARIPARHTIGTQPHGPLPRRARPGVGARGAPGCAHARERELAQQQGIGAREAQHERVRIRSLDAQGRALALPRAHALDALHGREQPGLGGVVAAREPRFERGAEGGAAAWGAVHERELGPQVKRVGQPIGRNLDALGRRGEDAPGRVLVDQPMAQQPAQGPAQRIGRRLRVEGGLGLPRHPREHGGSRPGRRRAAGAGEHDDGEQGRRGGPGKALDVRHGWAQCTEPASPRQAQRRCRAFVDPILERVIASADERFRACGRRSKPSPSGSARIGARRPAAARGRVAAAAAFTGPGVAVRRARALDRTPGHARAAARGRSLLRRAAPRGGRAGGRVPVARARGLGRPSARGSSSRSGRRTRTPSRSWDAASAWRAVRASWSARACAWRRCCGSRPRQCARPPPERWPRCGRSRTTASSGCSSRPPATPTPSSRPPPISCARA